MAGDWPPIAIMPGVMHNQEEKCMLVIMDGRPQLTRTTIMRRGWLL